MYQRRFLMKQGQRSFHFLEDNQRFCTACEGDFDQEECNLCDGCLVPYHKSCFSDSTCQACDYLVSQGKIVDCSLCPQSHMILNKYQSGWAHMSCMRFKRTLLDVATTNRACLFCNQKEGLIVSCSFRRCTNTYHVGCAKVRGLVLSKDKMSYLQEQLPTKKTHVGYEIFCMKHLRYHHRGLINKVSMESVVFKRKILDVINERLNTWYAKNQRDPQDLATMTKLETKYLKEEGLKQEEGTFNVKMTHKVEISIPKNYSKIYEGLVKRNLWVELENLKKQFLSLNQESSDNYLELDPKVSMALFQSVISIHNVDAFDQFIWAFLRMNGYIDGKGRMLFNDPKNFWRRKLVEMHLNEGCEATEYIYYLRCSYMHVKDAAIDKVCLQQQFEKLCATEQTITVID